MIYAPIAPLPLMQVPDYTNELGYELWMDQGMTAEIRPGATYPSVATGPFVQRPAYVYWGESRSDPDSVVLTISSEGVATIYFGAKCPNIENCTIKAVRVEQAQ